MNSLDRAGLDYLIDCAKQIGFAAIQVETVESLEGAPLAMITFRQTREVQKPEEPKPSPETAPQAEKSAPPAVKYRTLDDTL